jgi:hypothetical protein
MLDLEESFANAFALMKGLEEEGIPGSWRCTAQTTVLRISDTSIMSHP